MKTEIELINLLEKYKEKLANIRICYIKLAKQAIMDIYTKYDENNPILVRKFQTFKILMPNNDKDIATITYPVCEILCELDQKTAELVCIKRIELFDKVIYSV